MPMPSMLTFNDPFRIEPNTVLEYTGGAELYAGAIAANVQVSIITESEQ